MAILSKAKFLKALDLMERNTGIVAYPDGYQSAKEYVDMLMFALKMVESESGKEENAIVQAWVKHYCEEYQRRYMGINPVIDPKDVGQLKRLKRVLGLEQGIKLISAYLSMNDVAMIKQAHPLSMFVFKLAEIKRHAVTGVTITNQTAKSIERQSVIENAFKG